MEGPSVSQMGNKKDSKMDSSGQNRSKDIRIENFDISYGERYYTHHYFFIYIVHLSLVF